MVLMGKDDMNDRAPSIAEDPPQTKVPSLSYDDYDVLNRQTAFNRAFVDATDRCGCFHCGSTFAGSEIATWMAEEEGDDTAICPVCGADAIVVGTDTLPLSTALLSHLYCHWFSSEFEERKARVTYVPHFAGFDDYNRKGIPFLYAEDDLFEVVGEIMLFPLNMTFDDTWFALETPVTEDDGGGDDEEGKASDDGEPVGGIIDIDVWSEEGDLFREIRFIDAAGKILAFEPWSSKEASLIRRFYDRYGSRLKCLVKDPGFGKMTLVVEG